MMDEGRLQRALTGLSMLALPLAAGLYLLLPPSMDQWQLDYTGWLITRGEAPYLDIRDGNWPAAHWLHALSVALSGPIFGGWRRFDLLLLVPTVVTGALLSARIWGRSAGYWFGLLYPCLYVSSGYWFAGQRDIVASHFGLFAIAAYWSAIHGSGRGRTLLSGASLTVATLIKPTFAIVAVVIALHAGSLVLERRQTFADAVATVARIAGWSIAALLSAMLILWSQGSTWESFGEHAVLSILMRIPNDTLSTSESLGRAAGVVLSSWHWLLIGSLIATGLAIRANDAKQKSGALLLWLFLAGGIISFVVQGHGFTYYLGPVFLGLSLLSSGVLGLASRYLSTKDVRQVAAIFVMLIALLGTGKKMVGAYGALVPVVLGEKTLGDWEDGFKAGDGLSAADARVLANELRPLLSDDTTLLVWGRANLLNLLVERPQPTGFYHHPHIEREYLPEDISRRWSDELFQDLTLRPPAIALVNASAPRSDSDLRRRLEAFLSARYVRVRAVGTSTLYKYDGVARAPRSVRAQTSSGNTSP